MAGAGRRDSALVGLAILAAGGSHGPRVNREAMVRQREQLNTGWMRLGEWFSTHPPLASRMAALDPALDALSPSSSAGTVRALGIIGAAAAAPAVAVFLAVTVIVGTIGSLNPRRQTRTESDSLEALFTDAARSTHQSKRAQARFAAEPPAAREAAPVENLPGSVGEELSKIQVSIDFTALAGVAEMERAKGALPADAAALYAKAAERNPGEPERRDAFGGQRYGYEQREGYFILRSAGPDGRPGTADDIVHDSRRLRIE
jgi:hypothetical protein